MRVATPFSVVIFMVASLAVALPSLAIAVVLKSNDTGHLVTTGVISQFDRKRIFSPTEEAVANHTVHVVNEAVHLHANGTNGPTKWCDPTNSSCCVTADVKVHIPACLWSLFGTNGSAVAKDIRWDQPDVNQPWMDRLAIVNGWESYCVDPSRPCTVNAGPFPQPDWPIEKVRSWLAAKAFMRYNHFFVALVDVMEAGLVNFVNLRMDNIIDTAKQLKEPGEPVESVWDAIFDGIDIVTAVLSIVAGPIGHSFKTGIELAVGAITLKESITNFVDRLNKQVTPPQKNEKSALRTYLDRCRKTLALEIENATTSALQDLPWAFAAMEASGGAASWFSAEIPPIWRKPYQNGQVPIDRILTAWTISKTMEANNVFIFMQNYNVIPFRPANPANQSFAVDPKMKGEKWRTIPGSLTGDGMDQPAFTFPVSVWYPSDDRSGRRVGELMDYFAARAIEDSPDIGISFETIANGAYSCWNKYNPEWMPGMDPPQFDLKRLTEMTDFRIESLSDDNTVLQSLPCLFNAPIATQMNQALWSGCEHTGRNCGGQGDASAWVWIWPKAMPASISENAPDGVWFFGYMTYVDELLREASGGAR